MLAIAVALLAAAEPQPAPTGAPVPTVAAAQERIAAFRAAVDSIRKTIQGPLPQGAPEEEKQAHAALRSQFLALSVKLERAAAAADYVIGQGRQDQIARIPAVLANIARHVRDEAEAVQPRSAAAKAEHDAYLTAIRPLTA